MGYAGYVPAKAPPSQLTPLEAAVQAVSSAEALDIIGKLVYNCAITPKEEKFRKVKLSNAKIASTIVAAPGGLEALTALGWVPDETEAEVLTLSPGLFLSMKEVRVVEAAKEKAKKDAEEVAKAARISASRSSAIKASA